MKFIKFILSTKKEWSFPEELAMKIILDQRQIYPIIEDDGKFHGRTINKAHIVETDYDTEAEKEFNRLEAEKIKKIDYEPISENDKLKNIFNLAKLRKNLLKRNIIH